MILDFGYVCMEISVLVQNFDEATRLKADFTRMRVGGRGLTQALAAARMGGNVAMIGAVGDDVFGREIVHRLQREGINTAGLARASEPTGLVLRTYEEKTMIKEIITAGANQKARAAQAPILSMNARALVMVQDDIGEEENLALMQRAKNCGARVMMHTLEKLPEIYTRYIDFLVLTEGQKRPACFDGIVYFAPHDTLAADCYCGALAAGIQTGAPEDYIVSVAKTMVEWVTKAGVETPDPLPYWEDIKKSMAQRKTGS